MQLKLKSIDIRTSQKLAEVSLVEDRQATIKSDPLTFVHASFHFESNPNATQAENEKRARTIASQLLADAAAILRAD